LDVRSHVAGITAVTFPPDDLVFAARVRALLDEQGRSDAKTVAAAIKARLQAIHPHVATRFRDDLAGFGQSVLYVFRDGSALSAFSAEDWIDDPTVARVVTDDNGTLLDANEAAEELFGVTSERLIGAAADSLTRPEARIPNSEELREALRLRGRLHSLSLVACGSGDEIHTEFVTIRDGDGPGRHLTILRPVRPD
jgi:PAS domain S-box-containing protein